MASADHNLTTLALGAAMDTAILYLTRAKAEGRAADRDIWASRARKVLVDARNATEPPQ